jgi:internalin A
MARSRKASIRPNTPELIESPPLAADQSRFLDPFDDSALLSYFEEVAKWHGYVRFLGLPHLQESADQPLHELYVEPFLAPRPVHVDEEPGRWGSEVEPALVAVAANPRLVVLGDPGSGKSTLVSWIAWQLSRPQSNPWREQLGTVVPLPMVLRELKLGPGLTWASLLAAFLEHPLSAALRGTGRVGDLLERGQAFLLLDGLDEIGSLDVRLALRAAIQEGAKQFPSCRVLVTSRAVGYEAAPLTAKSQDHWDLGLVAVPKLALAPAWGELRYVTPFTDEQIGRFARNWYARREAAPVLREAGASELVKAVRGSASTLRLARNPNLLTLMALIFRVQARLPHGRALLFEKIAEAYLESIDTFRGLSEVDYPLTQKKRWLAYVGFHMQLRRAAAEAGAGKKSSGRKESGRKKGPREVLADHESVVGWIAEAMAGSARGADPAAARAFVDYIGRRSGLLLPRGEGLYAFTHLSFQEYFAALYLAEQVTSPRWLIGRGAPGARPDDLRKYAGLVTWRETLVLLFELIADRPDWTELLAEQVFGEGFREVGDSQGSPGQEQRAALLAQVSIDPHVGLTVDLRAAAWEACWRWELTSLEDNSQWARDRQVPLLLSGAESTDITAVWAALKKVGVAIKSRGLCLRGTPFSNLALLSGLTDLRTLDLTGTSVTDVSALAGLVNLQVLSLGWTGVTNLSVLSSLTDLRYLFLNRTPVTDVSALKSDLPNLKVYGPADDDIAELMVGSRSVMRKARVSGT